MGGFHHDKGHWRALLEEAQKTAPFECCGLLLGDGRAITAILPAANVHPDPARFSKLTRRC
jgi:proteasome lid subunit RPN8/RPN11